MSFNPFLAPIYYIYAAILINKHFLPSARSEVDKRNVASKVRELV